YTLRQLSAMTGSHTSLTIYTDTMLSSSGCLPRDIRIQGSDSPVCNSLLSEDRFPRAIWIEALHLFEFIEGGRPQIFRVDDSVMAENEGVNASLAVLGRSSHQGEAPDHHPFDYEIHFAERRRGPLPFQNFEEISMVGLGIRGVSLFYRAGNLFAYGTAPTPVRVLPR